MSEKKSFLAPFYVMAIVVMIGASYWGLTLMGFLRAEKSEPTTPGFDTDQFIIDRLIKFGVIYLVLAIECGLYWSLRYRIRKKDFAWGHAIGVALAMVIIPTILEGYLSAADLYNADTEEKSRKLMIVSRLHDGLLQGFLLLGHLCFAIVLVDVWKRRREKALVDTETDVLNEYADQ